MPLYVGQLPRFVPYPVITSTAPPFTMGAAAGILSPASTAAVWPANNRAIYLQFVIDIAITVKKIGLEVAVQSGNLDVGIYNEAGTRLVSAGSTAVAAPGVQIVDITDTTLAPGVYFAAMSCSNTTASFFRTATSLLIMRGSGCMTEDLGSVTLPATATFAAPAASYAPFLALSTNTIL